MKKEWYKIKKVTRAGGLVETNSSSSHALCICSDSDNLAKPGDPEFDLDIRDEVLYVPSKDIEFGWEFEKTNHCERKLIYVCGLVFSTYRPLTAQKEPKRLTDALKEYLGIKKVIFEWEEEYKKCIKTKSVDENCYLSCPTIDHQSYSDSKEEILESKDTMINFIFNKKSWFFGGNDNSDDPCGYYSEMRSDEIVPDGMIEIDFPGIGLVDFDINLSSILDQYDGILGSIRELDDISLFDYIVYDGDSRKFIVTKDEKYNRYSTRSEASLFTPAVGISSCGVYKIVYVRNESFDTIIKLLSEKKTVPDTRSSSMYDLIKSNLLKDSDYIEIPVKIVSKEFGVLYDIH